MRINSIVLAASFAWLMVAFWQRNDLPRDIELLPGLLDEPLQASSQRTAFTASYGGVDYRLEPEYDYDLRGLVVSFRHHDGESRMHRRANDHLNMLDVCVVWGDNAAGDHLYAMQFWNGIFTCNVQTRDAEAWARFDMTQLSNNHLLSDDPAIRKAVMRLGIGDQIRVRGMLTSYSNGSGARRGTSTTRTDSGDGACETIYVESFEILRPAVRGWRLAMYAALVLLLGCLALHFRRPYRPYRDSRAPDPAFL